MSYFRRQGCRGDSGAALRAPVVAAILHSGGICGVQSPLFFFLRALYLGAEIRACSGAVFRGQWLLCRGRELLVDGRAHPAPWLSPKQLRPCVCLAGAQEVLFPPCFLRHRSPRGTVGGRQQLPPRHLVREHLGHLELQRFLIRFH